MGAGSLRPAELQKQRKMQKAKVEYADDHDA
jgi:hypothetical protein